MTIRSNKIKEYDFKNRLLLTADGDDTPPAPGTTVIPQTPVQTPDKPVTTQEPPKNNIEPSANPWENVTVAPVAPVTPQPVVVTNPEQPPTPEEQTTAFNERIGKMQFFDSSNTKEMFDAAGQGNMEEFEKSLNSMGQSIFKQAIQVSSQFTQQAVNAAVEKAVNAAGSATNIELATRELEANFEQAKNPMFAPVIKGVFAKFIKKGDDVPSAIANTKKYMAQMGQQFATKTGRPGSHNFNDVTGVEMTDEEALDFDAIMSQGAQAKPQ